MPSIYDLKPKFQDLLRPLVKSLALKGITANQVTFAALLLSIFVGFLVYLFPYPAVLLLVPITLFVRMALNAIDGMLAREHHMQSSLGAILNELSDVVSDCALYLPFALLPAFNPSLVVVIAVLAVISEMAGVVAVQIGASRRYDGPMGKSDRAFVFGLLGLLVGLGINITSFSNIALTIVLILLIWTTINRSKQALKELEE